jgi:hypothetical protein
MAWTLKDKIFSFFGWKERQEDSYKDINGKGILERFNETVAEEYDDYLEPLISTILRNTCSEFAFERMLAVIDADFGNFNDGSRTRLDFSDVMLQNKIVKYLKKLHAARGSRRCYEVLFGLLGFQLTLLQEDLARYTFDSPTETFDSPVRTFDMSCRKCAQYELMLDRFVGTDPPTPDEVAALWSVVFFNESVLTGLNVFTVQGVDLI